MMTKRSGWLLALAIGVAVGVTTHELVRDASAQSRPSISGIAAKLETGFALPTAGDFQGSVSGVLFVQGQQFMRVDDVVTVSGVVNPQFSGNGPGDFTLTIPLGAAFAGGNEAAGSGADDSYQHYRVTSVGAAQKVKFFVNNTAGALSVGLWYQYTYRVK